MVENQDAGESCPVLTRVFLQVGRECDVGFGKEE